MRSEIIPEGDESRHPFFVNKLPFVYRMIFRDTRRSSNAITYTTPHEIILNLFAFQDDDRITYVNRESGKDVFTITVNRFKVMLAESIYNVSHDDLELLYMRLLLTNRFSKTIIDRGRFRHLDGMLKDELTTIRGGYDSHLTYERRSVISYFKWRRLSVIHLLAVIGDIDRRNDIQIHNINIPKSIANQGLLYECLRTQLSKQRFRLYSYDPVDEDNIQPLKIDKAIIQVINQLIN